eukprot:jgi/Bigna1/76600/fgenesh1_pg.42_\
MDDQSGRLTKTSKMESMAFCIENWRWEKWILLGKAYHAKSARPSRRNPSFEGTLLRAIVMTPDDQLIPSKLKVVELRKELQARNLNKKGRKAELIARLDEYLAKNQSQASQGESASASAAVPPSAATASSSEMRSAPPPAAKEKEKETSAAAATTTTTTTKVESEAKKETRGEESEAGATTTSVDDSSNNNKDNDGDGPKEEAEPELQPTRSTSVLDMVDDDEEDMDEDLPKKEEKKIERNGPGDDKKKERGVPAAEQAVVAASKPPPPSRSKDMETEKRRRSSISSSSSKNASRRAARSSDEKEQSRPPARRRGGKIIAKIADFINSNSRPGRRRSGGERQQRGRMDGGGRYLNGKRMRARGDRDAAGYDRRRGEGERSIKRHKTRITIKSSSAPPPKGRFESLSFKDLEEDARKRGIVVVEEDDGENDDQEMRFSNITIEIVNDAVNPDDGSNSKASAAAASGDNTGGSGGAASAGSARSPSRAMRIDGFVRPFRVSDVRKLLEKHGNVVHFWMDKIRTHCYTIFSSEEEAAQCKEALDGLVWSEGSVKTLKVLFVAVDEAIDAARPKLPTARRKQATKREEEEEDREKREKVSLKTLDELFKRTTTKPPLYWLPLTDEEVEERERKVAERRVDIMNSRNRMRR